MNGILGGTLKIEGDVLYSGSRDELQTKLRERDDEIDRLRVRIQELEQRVSDLGWEYQRVTDRI